MPVQAQVRKIAGVGISAVCLLFVIIGLSTKRLYVGENTESVLNEGWLDVTARCSFGIREYTVETSYAAQGLMPECIIGDLLYEAYGIASLAECQAGCAANPECKFITYGLGRCIYKNGQNCIGCDMNGFCANSGTCNPTSAYCSWNSGQVYFGDGNVTLGPLGLPADLWENVDLWDYQQIETGNSRRRAAKKKLADTLKAAFAFLFLGLVVNSLQCVAFLVEVFWQPRPATRRAAIGGGVAMAVFYLIGFACAIAGPKAYVDFANASGLVSYSGQANSLPYLVAKPGVSSALLITAWIGSLGTIALALLERYGETTPAEDGAAPSSISLGREPKGNLEAPAADEVPAAQGV